MSSTESAFEGAPRPVTQSYRERTESYLFITETELDNLDMVGNIFQISLGLLGIALGALISIVLVKLDPNYTPYVAAEAVFITSVFLSVALLITTILSGAQQKRMKDRVKNAHKKIEDSPVTWISFDK